MLKRITQIKNGERYVDFLIYACNDCGKEIKESDRHLKFNKKEHYCIECSFKNGFITGNEYLEHIGVSLKNFHAAINSKGEIIIWQGKETPPWERKYKNERLSPDYINWRILVFERDNYTCQVCKQVGGNLNAHHIKSFAKYKNLRTDVNNGITLCEKCHKAVHKRK